MKTAREINLHADRAAFGQERELYADVDGTTYRIIGARMRACLQELRVLLPDGGVWMKAPFDAVREG